MAALGSELAGAPTRYVTVFDVALPSASSVLTVNENVPSAAVWIVLPDATGTAELQRTDSGWRIELDATGLPRRDDGQFYEAWLRNEEGVLVSIGTFNEGADVVLWAGVVPSEFSTMTITAEEADGDPASSGIRVLTGTVELD